VNYSVTQSAYAKLTGKIKAYALSFLGGNENTVLRWNKWLTSRPSAALKWLAERTVGKTSAGAQLLNTYATEAEKLKTAYQAAGKKAAISLQKFAETHKANMFVKAYEKTIEKYKAVKEAIKVTSLNPLKKVGVEAAEEAVTIAKLARDAEVQISYFFLCFV